MQIFRCSDSKIKRDDNGTFAIFLPNGAGVLKISTPEILAMASEGCSVIAEQAQVPSDFIQKVVGTIEIQDDKKKDEKKD